MQSIGCLVCGASLQYQQQPSPRACALCGRQADSEAACSGGYFVCDQCHLPGQELGDLTARRGIARAARDRYGAAFGPTFPRPYHQPVTSDLRKNTVRGCWRKE